MKTKRPKIPPPPSGMRLNRFLSVAGVCSRRAADTLIRDGKVSVNGTIVTEFGVKIEPGRDRVFLDGREVVQYREQVYIVLNKPKDCITTTRDERGRRSVMDYVSVRERIFPVGRLDRNTTGVLLLTNDGEFANALMHPRSEITKAYRVVIDKPLAPADEKHLARGVRLADGVTLPADVTKLPAGKNRIVGIVIREGRNRQIHRMFEALGYTVEKLDRVAYAGITTDGLPRGRWRYLRPSELRAIRQQIGV